MPYVMEGVQVLENAKLIETNFIVKGGRIQGRDISVQKCGYIRNRLDNRIITPTHSTMGDMGEYRKKGEEYSLKILGLGCTTVVFPLEASRVSELEGQLSTARRNLASFPLDYLFIVRVPAKKLTMELVRACKRMLVPAVIVSSEHPEELQKVPWSWIRQATFPYKMVFILENIAPSAPVVQTVSGMKLPHWIDPIVLHEPIGKELEKKVGIFPERGFLRNNGEVTYNIFEEKALQGLHTSLDRHYDKIEATVYKNRVVRYGETIDLSCSEGMELRIKVPGFFQ
ncbi:MAG: hypothetical protein ACI4XL_13180 [Bacillus sp. (in: firmicutes)]